VIELCNRFKRSDSKSSTGITVAKTLLEAAEAIVPRPFNLLVRAGLQVVKVAQCAKVNERECIRLAGRIARISFIVLDLTVTKHPTGTMCSVLKLSRTCSTAR
jgi:hypothetical protein